MEFCTDYLSDLVNESCCCSTQNEFINRLSVNLAASGWDVLMLLAHFPDLFLNLVLSYLDGNGIIICSQRYFSIKVNVVKFESRVQKATYVSP